MDHPTQIRDRRSGPVVLRLMLTAIALACALLPAVTPPPASAQDRRRRAAEDEKKEQGPHHLARPRSFDLTHVRCELEPFFDTWSIKAKVQLQLTPIVPALNQIVLNQVGFDFSSVQVNGETKDFATDDEHLIVKLGRWAKRDENLTVTVEYTVRPKNGMFFHVADGIDPDATATQLHTQGEMELNRYWLCCYDAPNDKTTQEMILTVPAGMVGLSNGKLVKKDDLADGRHVFHWRQDIPHVTYLISVVIGEFEAVTDEWDGIPMTYWVPPSAVPVAKNSFGRTPEIMEFLCGYFGVRFPWAKYDQTIIHRFRYGGMENTTLTNMTDRLLHDDRAKADGANSESIVVHELAHQWFGDMVTMRSWSHLWLNEGFATYSEALWTEKEDGRDGYLWRLDGRRGGFTGADNRNVRPIVRYDYTNMNEMFDGRTYQKGSWVLHMLRAHVGEEVFREILKTWVESYRGPDRSPVTNDLRRIAEQVSKKSLGTFFDQWLYKGGWPKLDVSWRHADGKLWLTIKQTQKVSEVWPLFDFPLTIAVVREGGDEHTEVIRVRRAEETFVLPLDFVPHRVRIDPGHSILRELTMHQSEELWVEQLLEDTDPVSRREALGHFVEKAKKPGETDDAKAICGYLLKATEDAFEDMRQDSLGRIHGLLRDRKWVDAQEKNGALVARCAALLADDTQDIEIRCEALKMLGRMKHEGTRELIETTALNGHRSYAFHAASVEAVALLNGEKSLPTLRLALNHDSYRESVRRAAIDGIRRHAPEDAQQLLVQYGHYGYPYSLRRHCLDALKDRVAIDEYVERFLLSLLQDDDWRIRRQVAGIFGEKSTSEKVLTAMALAAKADPDPHPRSAFEGAVKQIKERRAKAKAEADKAAAGK